LTLMVACIAAGGGGSSGGLPMTGLGGGLGEADEDLGSLLMDMGNSRQLQKVGWQWRS
jgi:hypothetical protein